MTERRQRDRRESIEQWECPHCHGKRWRTVDSRFLHDVRWRVKECLSCLARFDSDERLGRMIRGPVQKSA